jgi:hypothetical protein
LHLRLADDTPAADCVHKVVLISVGLLSHGLSSRQPVSSSYLLLHSCRMSAPTPSSAVAADAKDGSNAVTHFEGGNDGNNAVDTAKAVNFVIDNTHDVSNYAHWSFVKTLRHFWRAMAISFGCGICAMGDGYQYKMPGNIVALEGFIRQMGAEDPETGKYKLDPQHVALWGGKF